jgi:outer membrane protein insertion porin family
VFRLTTRVLTWAVIFGCFSSAFSAREAIAKSDLIQGLAVEGSRRIEKDAILQRVHSKPGMRVSAKQVRDDILGIFQLGYFESVEAQEEDVPSGVRLVFIVKEKPIIQSIEFEGLEEFEADEIKTAISAKRYEVLDRHKLNQSVTKLSEMYEEKGYYLADVQYDFKINEAKNQAEVKFIIKENDKVQVKSIEIIGNKVISDADLKKVMQTQEGGPFSWLSGSGQYREAIFERDIQGLSFYYGTLGYVRARFGKPEVSVSADKKFIYITFSVEEGEEYRVGKIDFSGELLYRQEELLEGIELVEGDVFNTDVLRRETLRFTEKYADLGYAFANVVPQPVVHDDTKTVDVTFEVDKGSRIYIGQIVVTGNTRTKDKVIRRELRMFEGELYNGTFKRISRENVMRLGFFENVEFNETTNKTNPNVVDIEIKLKERSTGQLVIGAGYASGGLGFQAQIQLSQNNFMGNGQVASASAQILTGRKYYEFNLSFQEPYVGASLWSLGGALYQIRRQIFTIPTVFTFDEVKTGADIKLGHPVLEFTNLFLTYKVEQSSVNPETIIDKLLVPPSSVNGTTSSLTTSVVYDKRDDRFDPREGLYGSLGSEFAGLGGNRKFLRTTANVKFFHPIGWDFFVFRSNFMAGNISPFGGSGIPINELYIQGGLFSQRGYDFLSIGPKDRLHANTDLMPDGVTPVLSKAAQDANVGGQEIVIGGRNQLLMQAELEFPILKEAKLRGVLFFDAGNSFNDWDKTTPKIFANYGFGFRWFTPIGPLRFEFGYPIVEGRGSRFIFTIGPPF